MPTLNSQTVIALRAERAWSQQHLSEVAGLSLRTVQRVERDGRASPETVKAICAAFDVVPATLQRRQLAAVHTPSPRSHGALLTGCLLLVVFLLQASSVQAQKIMLHVSLAAGDKEPVNVQLLNEDGEKSEFSLDDVLRVEFATRLIPEGVRIETWIFDDSRQGQLLGSPAVHTGNRIPAMIQFTDAGGNAYDLTLTPDF